MRENVNLIFIDTTEEFILNQDALHPDLRGWRAYRIEYGGCNEDCIWEGRLLLPPCAAPDTIANMIMGMQCHEELWETEVK